MVVVKSENLKEIISFLLFVVLVIFVSGKYVFHGLKMLYYELSFKIPLYVKVTVRQKNIYEWVEGE